MKADILEVLYKKHYSTAIVYTLSLCKNKQIVEDITSEAFLKAYLTFTDLGMASEFKYWLLRVCKNLWVDYTRKQNRISDVPFEEHEQELSDITDLSSRLIQNERYRYLYDGILQLPDNYRELLTLFYFGNCSVKQLAEMLGKSEPNIKTTLFRAREKLKSILEESGYEF